ncbi:MAG: hydrogenobyrinic acid a,c-diamide synthase (glutamine-hydrolyzing) [Peptococcaceae bacterium]|nr:MAG: hydrogenobyrinic acid a,c-diamide synthase (glutamine-hydrolyzing) [Peptococcaceae bacterium]
MEEKCRIPRLVIAAPHGRSGKTAVSVGLMAAFTARGMTVQAFKKGPDYIDPSWLTVVTGRQCRNLDSFLMSREALRESFVKHAGSADIGVIEGAMGLYDGVDLEGSGSTAEIAKAVQAPVLLVVDTTRMTRSAAALVMGFQYFDRAVRIAGVILNKVARSRHEAMLRSAVERYCGVPVLGVLPKDNKYNIPDRHLGLVPAAENELLQQAVERLGEAAAAYFDLDRIMVAAGSGEPLSGAGGETPAPVWLAEKKNVIKSARPLIGVFWDRAFTFYYPENLEALVAAGADLVAVDALCDRVLPDVDALYIGGGFPEVFASELAANSSLRAAVRERVKDGLPVYAECGGLMYLGRKIVWRGRSFAMAGALPFAVEMVDKPQGHGYMVSEVVKNNPFFRPGEVIKGHEFHHSRVIDLDCGEVDFIFQVKRGWGVDGRRDGLVYKNVLATYNHLHAVSVPAWATALVGRAACYRAGNR